MTETHHVFNQPPPLVPLNLYDSDPTLMGAVERFGAGWAGERLSALGALLGSEEALRWGFDANENEPVLHTHDRYGARRDEVVFHPSWHELMRLSIGHQLHSLPWCEPRAGGHVARAAAMMLASQNEAGHTCPVSMTYSGVAALRAHPDLATEWLSRLLSSDYDPRFLPATEKRGAMLGMGMTEKQGGSDVRANTTQAAPIGRVGDYLITGHKWFCSAPMCDAFLILAHAPMGLTCFLLPRWLPDGTRNRFFIQRLKRKLGNRSNASSEVEFEGAWARIVGEEGRGVATIIEMVSHTRLDCVIGSAGTMRRALIEALNHARHRSAFGKKLAEQPLMRSVLADLTIESEAATLLMARLASAFDARDADRNERAFARIATAVSKYWICKRTPAFVAEALECLGGNGFVEESILPRLYREAPLNGIWEGSGNVICLDVLRALSRDEASREALAEELRAGDALTSGLYERLMQPVEEEARMLVEQLAVALQTSLLRRYARGAVADAFTGTRAGKFGAFGAIPAGIADEVLA